MPKKYIIKRKTIAEKRKLICEYARRNKLYPHDVMNLFDFISLNYADVETICNWRERNWLNFNELCEWEYFANREHMDVPTEHRTSTDNYEDYGEKKDILPIEMFNKYNKIQEFPYELYVAMTKCIHYSAEHDAAYYNAIMTAN